MSLPFLLEIGTEEIPDWMIEGAFESIEINRFLNVPPQFDATPRRLVIRAEGIPERQADQDVLIPGPAKSAGTKAAEGFARKMGVNVDDLGVQPTPKGEYYYFAKMVAGRPTKDILAEGLRDFILRIYFPKTMYWPAKNGPRFIRPIRWIVALLGNDVIDFPPIAGVAPGNVTSGHRILGAAQIPVTIENYEQKLRENFVIISAKERERRIRDGVGGAQDEDLLKTLVYLTEYPSVISGSFDPEYLELPAEVLVTVMKHHQKYFAVYENGQLTNRFLAVTNTDGDPEGIIQRGNERVLRARFNDAKFFWQFDQRKKLEERVADLAHVTFHAKLGSYLEKTERVVSVVQELNGNSDAIRAAKLCKTDLTTELVKEFTELQGIVGGLYARAQGENWNVWRAIYDHYRPTSMEGEIPEGYAGRLLSIADRLDTLRGCFRIGLIPTGSKDPFALRRAAQGIVKIVVEAKLHVPIRELLGADVALVDFVLDRVRYYFREVCPKAEGNRGYPYDEVNAAIVAGWDDLVDVDERLRAVHEVRLTPDFEPVATSFKRIRNILRQAGVEHLQWKPGMKSFAGSAETDLYHGVDAVSQLVADFRAEKNYGEALRAIVSMRPTVDRYFDEILVNDPDPDIRMRRLTQLSVALDSFSTIADFSEIVTNT
jgi:glycyl-tRNA synthetase beta chain